MNRIDVRNLCGAYDAIGAKVAVGASRPPDADRFIGQLDMERLDVGFGIDRQSFDAQLTAGSDDAQSNFTAIGDEDFLNHFSKR
jgi:hypothetical protein